MASNIVGVSAEAPLDGFTIKATLLSRTSPECSCSFDSVGGLPVH